MITMVRPSQDRKRYIFAVSDATGKTCMTVVNAALSQFRTTEVILETTANVRSIKQIREIIARAVKVNGIIIYTMVADNLRQKIDELGRMNGIPTVDVLGPVLIRFSDLLEISPLAQPGLFRQLDDEYFKRIEAVDFTIKHDDSLGLNTMDQSEIVLVGVSRTTKTPVSIYLSYRGWKVANIPIIHNQPLPSQLFQVNQRKVIGLTINPGFLQLVRIERQRKLKCPELKNYTDLDLIKQELSYALRLYQLHNWPIINVTNKSIEETSTEVMRILHAKMKIRQGNNQHWGNRHPGTKREKPC